MTKRIVPLILLGAAFLALRGDSCFLKNKNIDVPFRGDVTMQFTSQGTMDAAVVPVDFGQELDDVENDVGSDVDSLVTFGIEGGFWRLVENRGDPGTTVTGSIRVTRLSTGASADVVSPTSVAVESIGHDFQNAPLNAAGTDLILQGFDEYVAWRNAGKVGTRPDLRYQFTWSSQGSGNVDFDWEAKVVFTLVGVFQVEVPDLWH
jgi:hypothetical protein